MPCLTEAALSDLTLMKLSQVPSVPSTNEAHAHIQSCPKCTKEWAHHLRIAQGIATAALEFNAELAGPCLDENVLAEFVDRVLDNSERDAVMHHLAHCQSCVAQVAELTSIMEEVHPTTWSYWFKRVADKITLPVHPAQGFMPLSHEPAMVLEHRNDEQTVLSWTQETGDCSVQFDLHELKQSLYAIQLTVRTDSIPLDKCSLVLRVNGNILQAQPLQQTGRIKLDDLSAQCYEIEIVSPEGVKGNFELFLE